MTSALYTPRRLIVSFGGKSHATDGHNRVLCDPERRVNANGQVTVDATPTCGWCRLILRGGG